MILTKTSAFFGSVLTHYQAKDFLALGSLSPLFPEGKDKLMYDYLVTTVMKYGVLPSVPSVEDECKIKLPTDKLEVPGIYLDKIKAGYIKKQFQIIFDEVAKKVGEGGPIGADYIDEIVHKFQETKLVNLSAHVGDIASMGGNVIQEYKIAKAGQPGIILGYQTLDTTMMGARGGDLLSVVGATKMGKSWFVMNVAINCFLFGYKVLFVSMEMSKALCEQRFACILSKAPATLVRRGELPNHSPYGNLEQHFIDAMKKLGESQNKGDLLIVDANLSANVEDVVALAAQYRPDMVIVDGAYLLSHKASSHWERIMGVAKALKRDIATNMNTPTMATWQWNKDALNKMSKKGKKSQDPGLEDIGGGMFISQVSSLVMSINADEDWGDMFRKIKILAGRSGETGEFTMHFNFKKMLLGEYIPLTKADLDNEFKAQPEDQYQCL